MAIMLYPCCNSEYSSCYVYPTFQHQAGLIEHLTLLGADLYAKILAVADDVEVTVHVNGLSPGIVWYVQQFVSHLGSNPSSGVLGVRACFNCLPLLEAALPLCDMESSLDYIVVQNQLKLLVNACRDVLVVRAQFLCPAGDRASFEAVIAVTNAQVYAQASCSARLPNTHSFDTI